MGHSPRTHARHRSDITSDVKRLMKNEEFRDPFSSAANLDDLVEDNENDQEKNNISEGSAKGEQTVPKVSEPLIPSIDIEINVTINIDSGQMVLLSEDTR